MRYAYRVSKYDPRHRDVLGNYRKTEWTHVGQVGKRVGGKTLTMSEYRSVEKAYLDTIREMLNEAGTSRLQIARLRLIVSAPPSLTALRKGDWVDRSVVVQLSRRALRDKADVELRVPRQVYLHFGFDFYVYIGLSAPTPNAIAKASQRGLHIEEMASPYQKKRPRARPAPVGAVVQQGRATLRIRRQ